MLKKPMNIQAIVDCYSIKNTVIAKNYSVLHDIKDFGEIKELAELVNYLKEKGLDFEGLSYYFYDYTIPQISCQFDLLRFGNEYNINLELKEKYTDGIEAQLLKHKQYLTIFEKECKYLTFQADERKFYTLKDNKLNIIDVHEVVSIIKNQTIAHDIDINSLFEPSKFMVSPFADDDRFINNQYFLNTQQYEIKAKIQKNSNNLYKIKGEPGSGKSLLVYDIAREEIKNGRQVAIIHGGFLNPGHERLKNFGWNIFPISKLRDALHLNPPTLIVDEAQRFDKHLISELESYVNENPKCKLILSFDEKQTFGLSEQSNPLVSNPDYFKNYTSFELTANVRTNGEIFKFIKGLFELRNMGNVKRLDNVDIQYFNEYSNAKEFISLLESQSWTMIDYTAPYKDKDIIEMQYNTAEDGRNAHRVIGQEFDKVIVLLGEHFYYDENKELKYINDDKKRYIPTKMLYQMVTRTRKELMIVIVKNENLFDYLLDHLNRVKKRLEKTESEFHKEGAVQVAKRSLKQNQNIDVELIAKICCLPVKEVESLKLEIEKHKKL